MTRIVPLGQHEQCVPLVAEWFEAEWPEYYATQPAGAARATFEADDHQWLVALDGEAPVGVIALRPFAIETEPRFAPGLGGLYVLPGSRGRGVGSALIEATTALARRRGVTRLYTATEAAQGLVERLGWRRLEVVRHAGEPLTIYGIDLV